MEPPTVTQNEYSAAKAYYGASEAMRTGNEANSGQSPKQFWGELPTPLHVRSVLGS